MISQHRKRLVEGHRYTDQFFANFDARLKPWKRERTVPEVGQGFSRYRILFKLEAHPHVAMPLCIATQVSLKPKPYHRRYRGIEKLSDHVKRRVV